MKQTVKVPLKDIKDFKKNSSIIENNSILPIYGFVKFDSGAIIKNSKDEFVIQKSNFDGSFLVEEKVLFNTIEFIKSSDVIFIIDDKKVTITDGKLKQNCASENIKLYPVCEEPPNDQFYFDENIRKALGAASSFTRDKDDNDLRVSHVFIGNKTITASDGIIAYCKKVDLDLPTTAIHKTVAGRISKMPDGKFSETERKCFYQYNNMYYGFSKTEATYIDLTGFFSGQRGDRFIVQKSEISDFNDLCLANSPLKYAWPSFSVDDGKMKLSVIDGNYSRDGEEEIDVVGKMTGSFRYDAALMNKILKSAPDEELTFHQSDHKFYITGESGFSSLIIELA